MKTEKVKKQHEQDAHRPLMDNKDEKKICPKCGLKLIYSKYFSEWYCANGHCEYRTN